MKKTVVLDCDGALFDFIGGYVAWLHTKGHGHVTADRIKSYLFLTDFGFSTQESISLFRQFTKEGGFRHLKPYPDATELFRVLKECGFSVIIATNAPTAGEADRIASLAEHGFEYDRIVFGPDKHKVVLEHDAALILDDHADTVLRCLGETRAYVASPKMVYNRNPNYAAQLDDERHLCLGPHPGALTRLADFLADLSYRMNTDPRAYAQAFRMTKEQLTGGSAYSSGIAMQAEFDRRGKR